MVLHIDSNAAYLVLLKTKSHIARYYFLSDHPNKNTKLSPNGAILVECKALHYIVSSSAEAEIAGIFHNAQIAILIRYILEAIGY